MRWSDTFLLVGLGTAGVSVAQFPTAHRAGVVIPVQLNGDPQEDFLVYDGAGIHAWRGLQAMPYFQAAGTTAVQFDRQAMRPVAAGQHLFVPLIGDNANKVGGIEVLAILADGRVQSISTYRLDPVEPDATVNSVRLMPLPFDLGNDGVPDVLAVWAETPRPASCVARATLLSWNRFDSPVTLDLAGGPVDAIRIAGIYPSRGILPGTDECMLIVSHAPTTQYDGLGFVTLRLRPADIHVTSSRWFSYAPSVRSGYWGDAWSPCAYGRFSPTPDLAVPVVTFAPGPSIVFHPDLDAPFVGRSGAWIDTSANGFLLDDAVADYDGDGADEVVIIERSLGMLGNVIAVTDPHPYGRRFQAFSLRQNAFTQRFDPSPAQEATTFHGAAVDVNGDGRKDLVLATTRSGQGALSLLLADPQNHVSGQGLVRIY